jgi:uncharacterized protein (TIGR02996 family)
VSTRDAFIAAILASPDDETARLVYADWLDENGEGVPAAFIRAQCQRARLDDDDPRVNELMNEEYRLRCAGKHYHQLLLAHLFALGFNANGYGSEIGVGFNRGLIEALEVYEGEEGARRFVDKAQEVLSHDPVTRLTFVPIKAYYAPDATTQDIEYRLAGPITTDTLGRLVQVERMSQIRELDLSGNPLDEEAVRLLTSSPQLSELKVLRVGPGQHTIWPPTMESIDLPAEVNSDCRARLRERFAGCVVFADER